MVSAKIQFLDRSVPKSEFPQRGGNTGDSAKAFPSLESPSHTNKKDKKMAMLLFIMLI